MTCAIHAPLLWITVATRTLKFVITRSLISSGILWISWQMFAFRASIVYGLWVCWEDFSRESPFWIVAEWGLPISLQNIPPQSFPSLTQCIELLDSLMFWDENLRLYLWYTWKWERYVSYCGTGKNLIRVTFYWPTLVYIYIYIYILRPSNK